jgi:hypothetical protein
MRLPNVEKAEITEAKVVRYLLSTTHRAGKSKAAFFMQFGFTVARWRELADALKQHAINNDVTIEERTIFGSRYVIEGRLEAPDGTWLNVRSAWFIDNAGDVPRFVTAHPLRRRRQ